MSALTQTQLYQDAVLQQAYGDLVVDSLRHIPGVFTAIERLGQEGRPQDYVTGARNFTFMVDFGRGGSAGFANTGNDVTHIGTEKGSRSQISFSYSFMYLRATADGREFEQYQKGGTHHFFEKTSKRVQAATRSFKDLLERLHLAPVGDGRLDTVTTTSAAIAAAASGTVAVNRREQFIKEIKLRVYRTNAYLSNVLLVVTAEAPVYGPGTITVTNAGSSSYTPTENDILFIDYAEDKCFFSSLEESVGSGAYPNRGQNIAQINDPSYASLVTSGGGAKITYQALAGFLNYMRPRLTYDFAERQYSPVSRQLEMPSVFFCSYEHIDALMQEQYAKQRYQGQFQTLDPTWGTMLTVDGISLVPSQLAPKNKVFFLHMPGWIYSMQEPKSITGPTAEGGVWKRDFGTDNYEALWRWSGGYYVADRMCQGRIDNITGVDFSTEANISIS